MKNRIITIITVLYTGIFTLSAQIKVASNNCVGVGVDNPVSKLSIGDVGNTYSTVYVYNSSENNYQRGLEVYKKIGTSTWTYGLISTIQYGFASYVSIGINGN